MFEKESFFRAFLTAGYVPMTNNAAEHSVQLFTVGRNNRMQINTVSIAKASASAIACSIAEAAKANSLKIYVYFHHPLEGLPKHGELEGLSHVELLLPCSEALPEYCHQKKTFENSSSVLSVLYMVKLFFHKMPSHVIIKRNGGGDYGKT